MKTIQEQVADWHRETFPNATTKAVFNKLNEEVMELMHEINVADMNNIADLTKVFNEIADVIIVSCALVSKRGLFVDQVVLSKLEINKKRTWGKEGKDGSKERIK